MRLDSCVVSKPHVSQLGVTRRVNLKSIIDYGRFGLDLNTIQRLQDSLIRLKPWSTHRCSALFVQQPVSKHPLRGTLLHHPRPYTDNTLFVFEHAESARTELGL